MITTKMPTAKHSKRYWRYKEQRGLKAALMHKPKHRIRTVREQWEAIREAFTKVWG